MDAIHPLLVYVVVLVVFVLTNLVLAQVAGPRKKTTVKEMPYESGMDPVGDARQPFDVKFYLVAILFLVFDVELLFLYPWAVASRNPEGLAKVVIEAQEAGYTGFSRELVFFEVLVFLGLLTLGFVYAWRKGVFRWR